LNEAETRAEHIDPALKAAGWGVADGSRILREYPITLGRIEGHGRRAKPMIADYVLVYRNHKLAVIEAKAWDESLTEGVAQAKDYADKLAIRFTYSTNGRDIYGIDMDEGKEASWTSGLRRKNSGTAPSRKQMRGGTASPPCPSRTKAATFRGATIRTSPLNA
jgi:type I restriction enzyme R subunit